MKLRIAVRRASLALLAATFATLAFAGGPATLKAGAFDPPTLAPDFTLPASNGGKVTLSQYRGRVVLLEFGFTTCPNVCPTTLAMLAQAHKRLGDQAKNVQVIFVTVDPGRDTADQMRAYLKGFNPTFIGGTGTAAQLAAVRALYGATAQRKQVGDTYTMGHSSSVYLIDRKGRLRGMMPFGRPAEDYVHDVQALLAE